MSLRFIEKLLKGKFSSRFIEKLLKGKFNLRFIEKVLKGKFIFLKVLYFFCFNFFILNYTVLFFSLKFYLDCYLELERIIVEDIPWIHILYWSFTCVVAYLMYTGIAMEMTTLVLASCIAVVIIGFRVIYVKKLI